MKNFTTILLLGLIAIVGVFTLDVYLPGMPAMAKDFNVSIDQICLTFTGFSIVFAITQVFHGILSDYIGRKPILLGGLALAAIATGLCVYAKTYGLLLAARLLQAIGISVFVVVNAIIRDLYTGAKAIQIRTFVATVSGVSISIAPTIGGLLQDKFDWQASFIVSLLLIVIAFVYTALFFKESNSKRSTIPFSMASVAKSYLVLFFDRSYLQNIIIATLAYTVHFSFIIVSAKIFIDVLGFTPLTFGYLMFIYGGVYFISGIMTASLAKKFSVSALLHLGGALIGVGGVLMLVLLAIASVSAWQILLPIAITTIGVTTVRAAATTGALAPIPTKAGQGAAGLNLVQFMLSAIIATGISGQGSHPQLSLALLAILCSVSIIILMNLNLFKRLILVTE
jgi:MFS transporter, DHA1 family, multidrug resistance protein